MLSGGQSTPATVSVDLMPNGPPGESPQYVLSTCCPWRGWVGCSGSTNPDGTLRLSWRVTDGQLYYASALRCVVGQDCTSGPAQYWGAADGVPLPEFGSGGLLLGCVLLLLLRRCTRERAR